MKLIAVILFWSFLLAAGPAFSQFVSAPTGLRNAASSPRYHQVRYKKVPPGICEQRDDIASISGYIDISANEHIFFWFFEARNVDPSTAPLTTWINGGPGTSSMVGLFQEVGPCSIDQEGKVVNNPYSWTNYSNLLFIDQPVQTGFSYSKTTPGYISPQNGSVIVAQGGACPPDEITNGTCGTYSNPDGLNGLPVSTATAASSFYASLQAFMYAFPGYARPAFHFATESYGGHYGPVFSEYFETQNANPISGYKNISVAAVTVVNGWFNPLIQYPAYYNFTVSPGNTYDYSPYNSSYEEALYQFLYGPGGCVELLNDCATSPSDSSCSAADNFCLKYVENFFDAFVGRDEDDIRQLLPDPYPPESYVQYLNNATVQAAIGAYVNYTEQSVAVASAFNTTGDDGRLDGTTTDVRALLDRGVTVTMVYGDADYNSNWLGGEAVYNSLLTPGSPIPGYVNITTADNIVHGQAKQSGRFTFVRVYESGHEVPYYQPLTAYAIFERIIYGVDIATGETTVGLDFVTDGPAKSTYREGNASMVLPPDSTTTGTEQIVSAETFSSSSPNEKAWSGTRPPARVLAALNGAANGLNLVTPNSTTTAAPHGNDWGLANLELKHKIEEMVHITRHHRRRKRRGLIPRG